MSPISPRRSPGCGSGGNPRATRRRTARGLPPEPQPGEGRGDNMDQDDDRGDKYDRGDRYDRGDKYEVQR